MQGKSVIIELPHGPMKFRSTSVKPYFIDNTSIDNQQLIPNSLVPMQQTTSAEVPQIQVPSANISPTEASLAKAPLKKTPFASLAQVKQSRRRPRKYSEHANIVAASDICFLMDEFDVFINKNADDKLAQYTVSRQKEVAGLLEKGVFKIITTNDIPSNAQIFNSRFVDKIKNLGTDKAYEKSLLVIQAYNDQEKDLILTQSSTIQRVSQRLIVCLTAIFKDNNNIKLYLQDVMQASV